MKINFGLLLTLLAPSLVYAEICGCSDRDTEFANRSSAPEKMWQLIKTTKLQENYTLSICQFNPWYLMGDFDGNDHYDFALILHPRTGAKDPKLAVIWDTGKLALLERDEKLQFPRIEAWHLYPKNENVLLGAAEGVPPTLIGDGIMIYKLESSSSLVYWDGARFTYYWQGD